MDEFSQPRGDIETLRSLAQPVQEGVECLIRKRGWGNRVGQEAVEVRTSGYPLLLAPSHFPFWPPVHVPEYALEAGEEFRQQVQDWFSSLLCKPLESTLHEIPRTIPLWGSVSAQSY